MRRDDASADGQAGFALIEVLAAVAIAGLTLAAVAAVVAGTQAAVRSASDRMSLTVAARSLLGGMSWTEGLRVGTTTGVLGATRWQIDVAPRDGLAAAPPGAKAWTPATITLSVRSQTGRSLRVEAIGLLAPPSAAVR